MPYVQTNKYGDIEKNSPCWNCENAYVEDIWLDWMCRAKECPYQKEQKTGENEQIKGRRLTNAESMGMLFSDFLDIPFEHLLDIPNACRTCSNHPSNGGSGICHCILGIPQIKC